MRISDWSSDVCSSDLIVLAAHTADMQAWIVSMKEAFRQIPDHGMAYGLLRYGGHSALHVEPQLSYNFVGEISQFGGKGIALQRLGAGTERAADAARRHLLAFDGWQQHGSIVLSCRYAQRNEPSDRKRTRLNS